MKIYAGKHRNKYKTINHFISFISGGINSTPSLCLKLSVVYLYS